MGDGRGRAAQRHHILFAFPATEGVAARATRALLSTLGEGSWLQPAGRARVPLVARPSHLRAHSLWLVDGAGGRSLRAGLPCIPSRAYRAAVLGHQQGCLWVEG